MTSTPSRPATGPELAAILAATFGLLVMATVTVATELDDGVKEFVFDVGKAWIPHADHIGPYSGKETFLLVSWLGSWLVLRALLTGRSPNARVLYGIALAMLALATTLVWPPVWHLLGAG
ncbi:MAG: hypothetical protein ACT4PT_11560 [Methanobacteriota archaeon]